jgi:hypothetical protein
MRSLSLALSVLLTGTVACVPSTPPPEPAPKVVETPPLPAGSYEIQSISYDDADGAYRLFLVNPPPGRPPVVVATSLQMARLTDAELAAGKKTARLDVDQPQPAEAAAAVPAAAAAVPAAAAADGAVAAAVPTAAAAAAADAAAAVPAAAVPAAAADAAAPVAAGAVVTGAVARLPPDFVIEYTHNVVETQGGQQVVVRQERSTWSPFMSAMAGVAVGNMLFGPRYYYPPPYMGGAMTGFGGAGATPSAAAQSYTQQHGKAPQATKLSQSGYAKAPSSSLKSTGSGAGSSRLKQPASKPFKAPKKSFGRGFGRRR